MKNKSFVIPALREVSPDLAANEDKRQELQAMLAVAEKEAAPLRAQLAKTTPTSVAQTSRIEKLLHGTEVHGGLQKGRQAVRLAELDQQIGDIRTAIVLLDGSIARAKSAASAKICKAIQPEHKLRAASICRKLVELNATIAQYYELADAINDGDISWGFTPAHPTFLDRPNDVDSGIANYLREAVKLGNFDKADVPVGLR